MPSWSPCKRREFIRKLRRLGFSDPEAGGRHWFMRHGSFTMSLPSNTEYSVPQVRMLLREIERGCGIRVPCRRWAGI